MEGREKLMDIYGTDVLSTSWITVSRSARLSDDLFQQAIGHAAIIALAKGSVSSTPRSELNSGIQHLAAQVILREHAHFAEYVRFASMTVDKILDTNFKTIMKVLQQFFTIYYSN